MIEYYIERKRKSKTSRKGVKFAFSLDSEKGNTRERRKAPEGTSE